MSNSSMLDKLYYLEETKQQLKESIERRGVEISSDTPFRDFSQKIDEIKGEDLVGKAYLLDVIYAKNPDFEQLVNMDSSLTDIANIVLAIGPMNFTFKARINPITVTKSFTNNIDFTTVIEENLVNYLENPKAIPLREVLTNISVSPPSSTVKINIGG